MSYPPTNNYYGVTANPPNEQHYAATGSNSARSNLYQTQTRGVDDGRQSQYGAHRYGWNGQKQNTTVANPQNTCSNESWNDGRSNTTNAYHYQREMYAPSSQVANTTQRFQSRDSYNSQNTQGLNQLAYASGLDSSASLNNNVRSSQVQSNPGYPPPPTPHAHMRTASPANYDVQYSSSISQQSVPASQSAQSGKTSSMTNNPDLALNAATLADAARSRQRQPNQQSNNTVMVRGSNSPMMGNAQTTQQAPNRPLGSPNSVAPSAAGRSGKSLNNSRPVKSKLKNQAHAAAVSTVKNSQLNKSTSTPQPPQPNTDREQSNMQTESQYQRTVTNPQSISNLVSNPEDSRQETYESLEEIMMPNYIDPTQVFNPYHREHERKKREAAEAEARRKAEEQRLTDERRKADMAAMKASKTLTPLNNSDIANFNREAQEMNQTVVNLSSSALNEDTMAVEMQKMMEKMKEFRNTNPALFQKLWKDMRGNSNNTGATTAAQPPSPQTTRASVPVDASVSAPQSVRANSRKSETHLTIGGVPPNGFKVVVENNVEGLPDLGRFPAERRIRNPYGKNKPNESTQAAPLQDAVPSVAQQVPTPDQILPTQTPGLVTDPSVVMPEPRRRAIAVAAIQLLKSNPLNSGNPITPEEVCAILEHNPPYLDLCNALESRGLKFQRTAFARELLKNVPGLSTPAAKASGTTSQKAATVDKSVPATRHQVVPIQTIPAQAGNNYHVSQPPTNAYGLPLTEPYPPHLTPVSNELPHVKADVPKSLVRPSLKPTKARPPPSSRPEPPAGSKEAAARKRDFSELIDLTALNDNENYVLSTKQPRIESEHPHDPFGEIVKNLRTGFSNLTSEPLKFDPQARAQAQAQAQAQPQPQAQKSFGMPAQPPSKQEGFAHQPRFQAIAAHQQPQQPQTFQQQGGKSRMILAGKIDKSEALQKFYYDPKTVARDILVASGRHPSERPLNLHLAGLIGHYIELDSDVSTFDWDAVDPGGPPPTKVEYVDIPVVPPRFKLGERVRRRIKRTEPQADDAEQRRGLKGDTRQVGPAPRTPAYSSAASPAPSSLHPTSAVDRDRSNSVLKAAHRQRRRRTGVDVGEAERVTPAATKVSIDIPISSSSHRSTPLTSQQSARRASRMEVDAPSSTKKRGRPPGSKNKYPSVAAMKQQAKAVVVEAPVKEAPVEKAPEPIFHSYKCKWVKCYAELHNIDTLRRHILKKHTPGQDEVKQGEYVCWWKKCQYLEPDGDGNMAPVRTFENRDDWVRHVERDHIQPIAVKYGDGPNTSQTDPQSVTQARDRYLADSHGRSTTPLVTSDGNSECPPDAMPLTKTYTHGPKTDKEKADITAHNAFMKAHGNRHQDGRKAAEEVVRAMEVRKKKIGPGLDRGGCTLVNEARRSTLIQAPGISRIVDYEY